MSNQNDIKTNEETHFVGGSLLEFLTVTVKYRKFLFWFVFLITFGSTFYALVIADKWYEATASVLPAEKTDLLSTLSGLSSLAKGFSASKGLAALTGGNAETDRYMAILLSASVTDDVIKKFDLRKEYNRENDYYEKVAKDWQSNFELEVQDEGNLTLTVFDKDPKKAAEIANYLVDKLNEINTSLGVTNAKSNREFVEKRYFQNIEDINNLEQKMQDFQEKYGLIAVPEQLEATVKSMSEIYATLYKKEVEYNVIKERYGADHPLASVSEIEMKELQKKINLLNSGKDLSQQDVNLLIPFKQAPELGNQYLKIYRNLEIQYKILEFVQPLYEQAKVEEARNTPSVLVLDRAGPADRKSKPKGTLYALLSFVISIAIGFIIVIILESVERLRKSDSVKYNYIASTIKSDLKKFEFLKNKLKW